MVWGGISADGKTELVFIDGTLNSRRYITDILQPHVIQYAGAIGDEFVLMQDNARPHVSRDVQGFLANEGVEVMEWPACSPDLNPIEHVWSQLKQKVYPQMNAASTIDDLRCLVQQEWDNLPQAYLRKLVYSIRRRCQQCHSNRGGYTEY